MGEKIDACMDEMAFDGSLKVYVGTSNLKELTYILWL